MEITSLKDQIGHPVIDADGHLMEFMPVIVETVCDIGGKEAQLEFEKYLAGTFNASGHLLGGTRVYWSIPEANTLDRMTVTLPQLTYERLPEMGVDFALLYPSFGLTVLGYQHRELRRVVTRALNTYYASSYKGLRDRLEPVALIPLNNVDDAVEELDYAVGTLGLKAIVSAGVIHREDDDGRKWIDTVGLDSEYDYEPFWGKCASYQVVPSFHGVGYGWGSRNSPENYVYNHLGSFAAAQEAICRSLIMGGVCKRFPTLKFNFLEGGVSWAAQLYADLLSHHEKRNKDAVQLYNPENFNIELSGDLIDSYGSPEIKKAKEMYLNNARLQKSRAVADGVSYDDFHLSLLEKPEDIVELFENQLFFGCEADDPLNALAFNSKLLPGAINLNAMFASDIGHWDVPDIKRVLFEAWELVEKGLLDRCEFRAFAFGNATQMLSSVNPEFFTNTCIADSINDQSVG
tara:strand:+ start:25897 stop:27279 length:1383 start_codon:yes stop_codon:yes gene_type:complete